MPATRKRPVFILLDRTLHPAGKRGSKICLKADSGVTGAIEVIDFEVHRTENKNVSNRFTAVLAPPRMSCRIKKLPEDLISKIAAGEVIERPASVVKELVENAIDAGARNIRIEVGEGGRQFIRIIDDGCGMNSEELLLALERHATSKIQNYQDLFNIQTLGFRGEALPSVAAVSWMSIETNDGSNEGIRIQIEGGKTKHQGAFARDRGTTVEVRNLFFNTPARLKFLKGRETEFSHIANWLEAVALSSPEIGFILTHHLATGQVREEIRTPPRKNLRERIRDLLGPEIEASLRPISCSGRAMELTGFVSDHNVTSALAKSLFFFVNNRFVRDRTLQHAVMSGYENLMMKHRYPWVFLYLSVKPDVVDVNVHPTKSEVRFAQGSLVHDLVREGVRRVLRGDKITEPARGASPISCETRPTPSIDFPLVQGFPAENHSVQRWVSDKFSEISETPLAGSYKIIGQVHATYLLCETPDKLILIDQHAAHERIGFEKLKKEFEAGEVSKQILLLPETFELKPSDAEILRLYLDELKRFGLEVDSFGPNSFALRAIPTLLMGEDSVTLIQDLIEELKSYGKLTPLQERIHEVLETIACHRQIRAGDRLHQEEIEALLQEMTQTNFSYSCPHGRPVKVEISFEEIERWFRRRV